MPANLICFPALKRAALCMAACFLLVLAGCAAKEGAGPAARSFPEYPVLIPAISPAQALAGTNGKKRSGFTVRGGWGFAREDACMLTVPQGRRQLHHNSVPLERQLVQLRNAVEFGQTPPDGGRFRVTDYGTVSRTLHTKEGRMYAVWRGKVGIIPERPLSSAAGLNSRPRFPVAEGSARTVQREYWFDITETSTSNSGAAAKHVEARPAGGKAAQAVAGGHPDHP